MCSLQTSEKKGRRSVPVMDSPTKNIQSTQHRYKGTSEVENHKKRFSSDSEFLNLANKVAIPEASKKKGKLMLRILLFKNRQNCRKLNCVRKIYFSGSCRI